MMKRLLLGGFLGGAMLFLWGFISWAVMTWHFDTIWQDDGVMALVDDIEEHLPESGVYYFPPMSLAHQRSPEGCVRSGGVTGRRPKRR